jgi:hypothetical protein
MNLGKAGCVLKLAVYLVFVAQLRTASTMLLEFDCDLLPIGADAKVNVPEGTPADSLGDTIFRDGRLHCINFYIGPQPTSQMN